MSTDHTTHSLNTHGIMNTLTQKSLTTSQAPYHRSEVRYRTRGQAPRRSAWQVSCKFHVTQEARGLELYAEWRCIFFGGKS